jgi:hypothetical protein
MTQELIWQGASAIISIMIAYFFLRAIFENS